MKKFIFMFVAMLTMFTATVNAQKAIETSRFTDNVSVTLQGGIVTPFDNFFTDGSTTPVIVLGIDKYVTPWLGFGIEGRTSIGTGDNFNPHTAFDAVNVSAAIKFNVLNAVKFNGSKRFFEPVVYAALGWGHTNCSKSPSISTNYDSEVGYYIPTENLGVMRNYLTFRSGVECNFNLGKSKAWAIVVNPAVVWGNIDNARLTKHLANFEITGGIRYNFKNSNGTRTFKVDDISAMNAYTNSLLAEVESLKNIKPTVIEKVIIKEKTVEGTTIIPFEKNSSELTAAAKAMLDKIPEGATVGIVGTASPEGTVDRNSVLSRERAQSVADYLIHNRNVEVKTVKGDDAGRLAIVTVQ